VSGFSAKKRESEPLPDERARELNQPADALMKEELVRHQSALKGYARHLTRGRWDVADDVVQQTCLQAWRNKHRVDYSKCCKPWLMRIMKNEFLQIARKNPHHHVELNEDIAPVIVSGLSTALTKIEFLDMMQSISDLPAHQREAIVLVLAYGHTYEEAARLLGSHSGTVKSRVARGREKLIKVLND